MAVGLILVDIQNDYFPKGNMELEGSEEAAQTAAQLLDYFRGQKLPVFHIQHIATHKGATFFLPGSKGSEIYKSVLPQDGENVIQKHFPNSFRETGLQQLLEQANITQLVIAGMMTHMCLEATTRAAADYGFECLVAHDACATREVQFGSRKIQAADVQAAVMASLNGAYARVIPAEDIIAELDKQR